MSDVYLLRAEKLDKESLKNALERYVVPKVDPKDDVALKLHFGEEKGDTYVDPDLVEVIYREVSSEANSSVLMDCTVLYKSKRSLASSHKKLARENGFDFAPIVIADGEKGEEEMEVDVDGEIFDQVKIGGKLKDYNSLISIAHFTGHIMSGIGGALKNVGMGLGSKAGKLEMHETFDLSVKENKCVACGTCAENCPEEAISVDEVANIDHTKCIGCGECIAVCPQNAIRIPWGQGSSESLQKRISEYVSGVVKDRKTYFINVLLNITEKCDCDNEKQEPFVDDIGILFSEDIVAIDQASLDLIGKEKFKERDIDPGIQLRHAESIGLGSREYELKRL